MKLALILTVINPGLSGVLIRGEKGTAKSTAVRALAEILPEIECIDGNGFQLDPELEYQEYRSLCIALGQKAMAADKLNIVRRRIRVVELPVGATEDRLVGTLDLEHALKEGEKRIEPGILAEAHRNILYVDEVNLLDDHLVDVLLDSAAMGVNSIEREGISFSHPARFTLVGTMCSSGYRLWSGVCCLIRIHKALSRAGKSSPVNWPKKLPRHKSFCCR